MRRIVLLVVWGPSVLPVGQCEIPRAFLITIKFCSSYGMNALEERWFQKCMKGRIIGVKEQMSHYHIIFGLWPSCRVMKITENLSRTLQTQSISASESYGLAKMTCSTLQGMRTDDNFSLFFQRVELFRQQVGLEEPSLPRKRRHPQHCETGDDEPHYSDTVQDHYRKYTLKWLTWQ